MEAHIVSAESRDGATMNVVGSSVPGTPAIILGCNDRQCWGLTTNPLDVTDTYTERFVLNTFGLPTHTIYQGRQEPVLLLLQQFYVNQFDGAPRHPLHEIAQALALPADVPIISVDARDRESSKQALIRVAEYALQRLTESLTVNAN